LIDADSKAAVRLFATARVLATGAFVAEVIALGLTLAWFATGVPKGNSRPARWLRQPHWLWSCGALAVALATALVLAQGEDGWRLLLSRTLTALGTHPDPLVPALALNLVDLLVLSVCVASLLPWTRRASERAALALLLLGRASFDVPLGGLLVLVALLAVVAELPLRREPKKIPYRHFSPQAESPR
jgi:hypothetical protein